MAVSGSVRRRALKVLLTTVPGLCVAGVAWAQVNVPLAPMPPLVITPPPPPVKVSPKVAPIPVQDVQVPAVPAVRVTPIELPQPMVPALPPSMLTPPPVRTEVPEKPVDPPLEVPQVVTPTVTAPLAPPPVALAPAKPVKPAMAEIISVGPKAVDATLAFQTALADAKSSMAKVRDYSCHMITQDRVKGVVQAEQTSELRVRAQPRSVAVKCIAPSAVVGRELVFVDGRNGNKARMKQAGTYGPLAFASLPVTDAKCAVTAHHTLADTGLAAVIDRLEHALAVESKLRHAVRISAADFTYANRAVVRYEINCDLPHGLRDAARFVVCIDADHKMPVRVEVYDAPTAGKIDGDLREAVSFVNLSFNQGLGDAVFEK